MGGAKKKGKGKKGKKGKEDEEPYPELVGVDGATLK